MKIIHTPSGQAYQLTPGTQIEIERPNLFFNDYGEQSYPVDLPDTDLNRRLCGYPDLTANRRKPQTDIDAAISEGEYYMPCRQAVLGAKRREKITTSFYMNEGSFLSRMQDVPLVEVFGDETVPDVSTVQQGIDWCWSLRNNQDPHFAIFPIIAELDGERRGLNIVAPMNAEGVPPQTRWSGPLPSGYSYGFFHSFPRTETVDGQIIQLDPGYYLTPFIRATYLLQRVFSYFGYTLQDNFFSETEPFSGMVFVNNTADALVNGTILLAHLVPDCYCNTLIDVFRKKFCCEFVPDEARRTVSVRFFKDIMAAAPGNDLTGCLSGYPEITFQEPRQLKLSSENTTSDGSSYEGLAELLKKFPTAYYVSTTGWYMRKGYTNIETFETVNDGNLPYYAAAAGMEDYEVTVPDCPFGTSSVTYYEGHTRNYSLSAPYIGEGRMLNSTLEGTTGAESEEGEEESGDDAQQPTATDHKQDPVLAFVHTGTDYATGSNHEATLGYSLLYNGPIGIFEKFWRDFDNLLRNSLHQVNATLLLDNDRKRSLPAHEKITLCGNEYLVNILRYSLGGKNEPMESELLTTLLQEPLSVAPDEGSRFPQPEYYWEVQQTDVTRLTEEEWAEAGYTVGQDVTFPAIYPPSPTAKQYEAGGPYYTRTVYYSYQRSGVDIRSYLKATVSLVPRKVGESGSSGRPGRG